MSKKKIKEFIEEIQKESMPHKRAIDLYRDKNGHLKDIIIKDSTIDYYTFARLDLTGSVFDNVKFIGCKFQGVDFTNTILKNVEFDNCDLRWASLTKDQADSNIFINSNTREIDVGE